MDDPHKVCVEAAAAARGFETALEMGRRWAHAETALPWLRVAVGDQPWFFRYGVWLRAIDGSSPHVNGSSVRLTRSKSLTKAFLASRGFSVPAGVLYRSDFPAAARDFASLFGRPLCLKPDRGRKGLDVFPGITDLAEFDAAFAQIAARHAAVVIEESVSGEVLRFFYVKPRVVGLKISRPANVIGDGVQTLEALIAAKNRERTVRAVPGHHPIQIDAQLLHVLASRGQSLSSVPAVGERVTLLRVSNGSTGADTLNLPLEAIHPSYIAQIEAACAALPELRLSAVDTVIQNTQQPAAPGNHWILELNGSPGVLPYHHPWEGESQDICGAVLDMLRREGP
ncbi:MAG: hypothetical protein ACO1RX_07365 [Candidatus Sericytochromatia bacterium]